MKSGILRSMLCLAGLLTVPAYAMLSRASITLLRAGVAAETGYTLPPTLAFEKNALQTHIPRRTAQFARLLTATRKGYAAADESDDRQSDQNDDFGYSDNERTRWQDFFGRVPKAALGLSIFGLRDRQSDDDICQTPEDFHDAEKLKQTYGYAQTNGNDRIAELFIEKFDSLKTDAIAQEKVLGFLASAFDSIKANPQRVQALKQLALKNYKSLHKNKWGKEIIKKITHHQQNMCGVTGKTTFEEWKALCDALPVSNKHFMHSALSEKELERVVAEYKDYAQKDKKLIDPAYWLASVPERKKMYGSSFTPYVQKILVKPGSHIAFHGDLHGDVHALNNFLHYLQEKGYLDKNFTIIRDDFYMVFLGDYTDRGYYGAEVWYTILRLKLANKERVILVRGNHEDKKLNAKYGFNNELKAKFAESGKKTNYQELYNLYNFFPVALYLGCGADDVYNYLLCCHGGLELGFDPRSLLQDKRTPLNTLILDSQSMIDRSPMLKQLSKQTHRAIKKTVPNEYLEPFRITNPYYMGFMWNDFIVAPDKTVGYGSRGWQYGKQLTHELLKAQSTKAHAVRGVFRAHQHFDPAMMARILNKDKKGRSADVGVGKIWTDHAKIKEAGALWNGIVCTFLVAPAIFGKSKKAPFNFDAFGILITAKAFEDWKLKMVRLAEHQDQESVQQ